MNRQNLLNKIFICIIIILFSGLVFSQEPKDKHKSPEDMDLDDMVKELRGTWTGRGASEEVRFRHSLLTLIVKHEIQFFFHVDEKGNVKGEGTVEMKNSGATVNRILMVEDERMTRIALTGTLRKAGHEVTPCPDGDTALAALDNNPFDVVLTDLNLPGPDGIDILRHAVEKDPDCKVIIMTAYASTETAVEADAHVLETDVRFAGDVLVRPGRDLALIEDQG